jgi:hypothetical protein
MTLRLLITSPSERPCSLTAISNCDQVPAYVRDRGLQKVARDALAGKTTLPDVAALALVAAKAPAKQATLMQSEVGICVALRACDALVLCKFRLERQVTN